MSSSGKKFAVIGGGVAGMQTALRLAEQGVSPVIIEKEAELGGKLRGWHVLFPSFTPVQEVLAEDYTGMAAVIGADTMVVLDGKLFGKPRSASDGKHMLRQLSGRTHEVLTAVSVWMVAAPNAEDVSLGFRTFADISHMTFRDLTDEEITEYLRKGESFDKAGAYAIQGEGAALVDHYDGSLDTIIGLPATRLIKEFPDLVNAEAAEC